MLTDNGALCGETFQIRKRSLPIGLDAQPLLQKALNRSQFIAFLLSNAAQGDSRFDHMSDGCISLRALRRFCLELH